MSEPCQIDVSIVVPLYNEEPNVRRLYEAISEAMADSCLASSYEILFVDDGSSDRTFQEACSLADADRRLKVIRFRRNFGQTPAMAAGIDLANGKIVVTMDGDLQNDPRDIELLVTAVQDGADLAVGWRFQRQDKLISRKIPSVIANWLIGKVTGVPIKDNGCSLKAYKAEVIKRVPLYSEMHRFIPAMSTITGAQIVQLKVRHHARQFGESKYGLSRIYKVLFDLLAIKTLTTFSSKPLAVFGVLSIPFVLVIAIATAWTFWTVATSPERAIVVPSGVLVLSASAVAFLIFCGVLGELIFRTAQLDSSKLAMLTATVSRPATTRSGGITHD